MEKFIFNLVFLIVCNSSYAQLTSSDTSNLIYLNGFSWKQGDKKLTASALKNEVYKTSSARPYYKKGQRNAILSKAFLAGAVLSSLAATTNSTPYYHFSATRRISWNLLAVASFTGSVFTMRYSLKNKGKAVHLRNLDLLQK